MILDPYRKIKKAALFAGVFLAVVFFSALIMLGIQKIGQKNESANLPTSDSAENLEKRRHDMLDAINEANKNAPVLNPEERAKRQQEMLDAINEVNKDAPVLTPEEQTKRQQDMLDAINEANKNAPAAFPE